MESEPTNTATIGLPMVLPCGLSVRNRLCKAPMEEFLAHREDHLPNAEHFKLYSLWSKGGWGMIFTGNIQIDDLRLGLPYDLALPAPPHRDPHLLEKYQKLALSIKGENANGNRALAVGQICHAGRQSMRFFGRALFADSLAPSTVQAKVFGSFPLSLMNKPLFGAPRALTKKEIRVIIGRFVAAAAFLVEAGFDGIELHASHGYLLSSFLSPSSNQRDDEYGGNNVKRLRIVIEILEKIRARIGPRQAIGVKLNSSDYIKGGLEEDDALEHARVLTESQLVDWIQVSGGNYENPMMASNGTKTAKREGFFLSFAQRCKAEQARAITDQPLPAIVVTGGFRSRVGIAQAIREGAMDACAIERAAIIEPNLAQKLLDERIADNSAVAVRYNVPRGPSSNTKIMPIGAGWSNLWHNAQMRLQAQGHELQMTADILSTVFVLFNPFPLTDKTRGIIFAAFFLFGLFFSALYFHFANA